MYDRKFFYKLPSILCHVHLVLRNLYTSGDSGRRLEELGIIEIRGGRLGGLGIIELRGGGFVNH